MMTSVQTRDCDVTNVRRWEIADRKRLAEEPTPGLVAVHISCEVKHR